MTIFDGGRNDDGQNRSVRRLTPQGRFGLVVSLAILAAVASCWLIPTKWGFGHNGTDTLSSWYRSLKTPQGGSCCTEADCRPVEARLADGGWEILAGEDWQRVPPESVLRRENADGRPIGCLYYGRVLCFVPPAGS